MKYLHNFQTYLLTEAFDLNMMYNQQNIIPRIREIAKSLIERYFEEADNIPADLNRDKVEFWLAKQIKSVVIADATEGMNNLYNIMKRGEMLDDVIQDKLSEIRAVIEYFKGKNVEANKKLIDICLSDFKRQHNKLDEIFDYFLSPVRNIQEPIDFVTSTIDTMYHQQREWHNSLKASNKIINESGRIIKSYKDGYYWIDLLTNSSKEEGSAMGHCGNTNADTLISLRRRGDAGHIEPYTTIAINYQDGNKNKYSIIEQIKGKNNTKPVTKYHYYIVDLILDKDLGISGIGDREYSPLHDFHISDLTKPTMVKALLSKRGLFDKIYDYVRLFNNGTIEASVIEGKLEANGYDIENFAAINNKLYLKVYGLSEFANMFGIFNGEDFYNLANDIESNNYKVEFDINETLSFWIDDELLKLIVSKIDFNEVNEIDSVEYFTDILSRVDMKLDKDNLKQSILNGDTDRLKLKSLLSIKEMNSVYQVKKILDKSYSETRKHYDTIKIKEFVKKIVENEFEANLIDNEADGGYLLEISDYLSYYSESLHLDDFFIMTMGVDFEEDDICDKESGEEMFREKVIKYLTPLYTSTKL